MYLLLDIAPLLRLPNLLQTFGQIEQFRREFDRGLVMSELGLDLTEKILEKKTTRKE
jgi:hypothetical protein